MQKIPKLRSHERDLIAIWKGEGSSIRQMARRLGRYPSTISREIKRNTFLDKETGRRYYVAIYAQAKTKKRKELAGGRNPLKDPETYAYVLDKLREGWSPEQIAGRLKKASGRTIICHETIYRFIYTKENRDKTLWEYLPWKRKKRKKKLGRKVHRGRIPNRVSIRQRPEEINQRIVFGHWEGDTVEGKGHKESIHTEVERLSRFTQAKKIEVVASRENIKAQRDIFVNLPNKARRSTTLDNGRENHSHNELNALGMKTYFCDPYSSWQRGTNEHHNGLLRRYLPKGMDFSYLTQEELDDIVKEINNRPRKVLNYNTPQEVFGLYINKEMGVAIRV